MRRVTIAHCARSHCRGNSPGVFPGGHGAIIGERSLFSCSAKSFAGDGSDGGDTRKRHDFASFRDWGPAHFSSGAFAVGQQRGSRKESDTKKKKSPAMVLKLVC